MLLRSIRRKLPLLISVLLLGVVAAISWASYRAMERVLLDTATRDLTIAARQLASALDASSKRTWAEGYQLANDQELLRYLSRGDEPSRVRAERALERRRTARTGAAGEAALALLDASRRPRITVGTPPAGHETLDRAEIPLTRTDGDTLSNAGVVTRLMPAAGDSMSVGMLVPVVRRTAAANEPADTLGFVAEYRPIAGGSQVALIRGLIGAEAQLAIGNPDGELWTDLATRVEGPPPTTATGGLQQVTGQDGVARVGVGAIVPSSSFRVWVDMPRHTVLGPARSVLRTTLLIALAVMAVGALGAWLLSRDITTPLTAVAQAAEGIAAGDYSRRASVQRADELGTLAASFNSMAARVEESTRTLEEQAAELEHQVTQSQDLAQELEVSNDELARNDAELRALLEVLPDLIVVLGRDGDYRKIAPSAVGLLYRPSEDLVGKRVHDILPKESADFVVANIRRALDTNQPVEVEYTLEIAGRTVWFHGTVAPMRDDAVVWVARDVTQRKRTDQQLRESELRHRVLFEKNPLPMWLFDTETLAILTVNDAAVAHYGYSRDEFLGMTIKDLRPAEDVPRLMAELVRSGAGTSNHTEPYRHRKKDGSLITVEVFSDDALANGRPARLVLARDVTDREQLEAQFRQSQKMEAVGRLAGGIAHDFNNILTAIKSYSQLAVEELGEDAPLREDVLEIDRAADRAATLTRQLLAFSRQQVLRPRVLDLNETVRGMENMLGRLLMTDVSLESHLDPNLGRVAADPGQIEQVLMNLVVNARDAMPNGGQLTITTSNVEVDTHAHPELGPQEFPPGPYAVLTVSDTGEGMSRETQAKIFEPFYTTKEQGKGTGLGLSTVYGIVKQSGGFIWVYSELGQGTTFKIYFPRVDMTAEHEIPTAVTAPRAGGPERILVVEDDTVLRALMRRVLQRSGYDVLEAANGMEALRVVGEQQTTIALVISDLIMPEMRGTELLRELRSVHPDLPVLLVSGYTEDAMMRQRTFEVGTSFLEKPFTPDILVRTVRALLDGEES